MDAQGKPVRDAVVEQQGVTYGQGINRGTAFGSRDWIDQLSVTNEQGEFEIAYGKPAVEMILVVKPQHP